MIAFTQFIVSQFIVEFYSIGVLALISFSTICIALAGYLFNDIADLKVDLANNKQGLINSSNKKNYLFLAIVLLFGGNIMGFIACKLSLLSFFILYVIASINVVLYAWFLSRYKLLGNVLISVLISLVVLLCFYIEINHYTFTQKYYFNKELFVWFYAIFAFIINWLREVVKDLEDLNGDKLANRISIPSTVGVKSTKILLLLISLSLTFAFILLSINTKMLSFLQFNLIALVISFLGFMFLLLKANSINNYKEASFLLKCIMLLGVITPIFS